MKRYIIVGLSILFYLGSIVSVAAFDIPKPDGYVTDQAGVLSAAEKTNIEQTIQNLGKSASGTQVGILILPELNGESVDQIAFDVGNKWGVGQKGKDNGIMIVIAIKDHDWFIATGYGMEGAFPDAIMKRLGEKDFPPYFRKEQYADGILALLSDIQTIGGGGSVATEDNTTQNSPSDWIIPLLFILIFITIAILQKKYGKGRGGRGGFILGGSDDGISFGGGSGGGFSGGSFGGGGSGGKW